MSHDSAVIPIGLPMLDDDGRKRAIALSANCKHCGGCGLVSVEAIEPTRRQTTSTAACVCVYGRWLADWHDNKSPDVGPRLVRLAGVLAGHNPVWRLPS